MWTQQTTLFSVIIRTTAVDIPVFASTIVVSILRPDVLSRQQEQSNWELSSNVSIHPKVVEVAAAMVPLVQWS
jgi:hypothetical protein